MAKATKKTGKGKKSAPKGKKRGELSGKDVDRVAGGGAVDPGFLKYGYLKIKLDSNS